MTEPDILWDTVEFFSRLRKLNWVDYEIYKGRLRKLIPEDDSPLFWLIEKTGCVLTDYNNSLGMKMTAEQQRVFDAMRRHGFITDDYYDLTKQREKVRKERDEKAEK